MASELRLAVSVLRNSGKLIVNAHFPYSYLPGVLEIWHQSSLQDPARVFVASQGGEKVPSIYQDIGFLENLHLPKGCMTKVGRT